MPISPLERWGARGRYDMFRVLSCLTTEHDGRLVVLASVVCFLASLAAVNLFQRECAARGRARTSWIVVAGITNGSGIWATHFSALQAFEPNSPVAYDLHYK